MSYLANKFDCRTIAIIGSVVGSLGFILSYFATNIITLYFTFGVLGGKITPFYLCPSPLSFPSPSHRPSNRLGIGFGFIFLPAIVTVGFYFERRRAFATGIAVCGSGQCSAIVLIILPQFIVSLQGIGTFVLPPVIQALIENFGWRGCLLVLAAIIMMCALFGSFFKPLPPVVAVPPTVVPTPLEIKVDEVETREPNLDVDDVKRNNNVAALPKPLLLRIKEARAAQWAASDETINEESPSASQNSAPPPYSEVLNVIQMSEEANHMTRNNVSLRVTGSVSYSNGQRDSSGSIYRRRTKSALERKDTLITTPNPNEMMYSNLSLVVPPRTRSIVNLNQSTVDVAEEEVVDAKGFWESFLEGFDLKLLKRPSFLLLSSSGFLCLVGFFIPFIYISDRAKLLGKCRRCPSMSMSNPFHRRRLHPGQVCLYLVDNWCHQHYRSRLLRLGLRQSRECSGVEQHRPHRGWHRHHHISVRLQHLPASYRLWLHLWLLRR